MVLQGIMCVIYMRTMVCLAVFYGAFCISENKQMTYRWNYGDDAGQAESGWNNDNDEFRGFIAVICDLWDWRKIIK